MFLIIKNLITAFLSILIIGALSSLNASYEINSSLNNELIAEYETEGSVLKDILISEYQNANNIIPNEQISILDILNSSALYASMTGESNTNADSGIIQKLIYITDKLETEGSVSVTLKLQYKFYPEGTFSTEQEVLEQRQQMIDILVPIINDKMLSSVEMLQSIQIYDTIPYFTLTLNQNNFWNLLESNGIIDIELNDLNEVSLTQSSPLIQATTSWDNAITGAGQVVAVLDTGVRKSHAFLANKVVSEACYSNAGGWGSGTSLCPGGWTSMTSSGAGVNCSTSFSACNHGTHVAGIIAGKGASFSGVAKESKIIAIQIFTNIGGQILTYTSDQTKGLERVYALRNSYSIASVNMSIGGGKHTSYCNSDSRKAIIDNLLSAGIATVIAAGNDGYTNAVSAPGCIQSAITVGATSDGGWGRTVDTVDSYSNSASMIDLLAPGSAIYSSIATSNTAYSTYQGTSMAAPQVAGAFALLKSAKNSATVAESLNALQTSGKSVTDSKNGIVKRRIKIHDATLQFGTGSITVNISPAGATSIGAKWTIDGSTWNNSGTEVTDLPIGTYSITFKSIIHSNNKKVWTTPSSQSTIISFDGDSKSLSGTYSENDKDKSLKDFNGDGKSDILFRNTSNGSTYIYTMDGSTYSGSSVKDSSGNIPKPSYSGWSTTLIF
ncbi:MAG: S8 family serine peptidase [Helicobacteraceae bacterium]|nr:S8 family serine peptidase [Helicobacteraceae bacterium]